MIQLTKYIVQTGRIFGTLSVSNPDDAMLNTFSLSPGEAMIDGDWSADTHYIRDDVATLRPVPGLPVAHDLAAGVDWPVPDVPAGTVVLIDGEEVGTVDATGLVLSFSLAGIWQVDLRPPFPWLDASCAVTVT